MGEHASRSHFCGTDDDNRVNRLLLSRNVELLGYQATVAENGRVAMELLQSDAFDLLLLDIEMPEMDGLMLAGKIRETWDEQALPLIMLSSVGQIIDDTGHHFASILTKPAKPSQLYNTFVNVLAGLTTVSDGEKAQFSIHRWRAEYP